MEPESRTQERMGTHLYNNRTTEGKGAGSTSTSTDDEALRKMTSEANRLHPGKHKLCGAAGRKLKKVTMEAKGTNSNSGFIGASAVTV
jgi:hypothetical protein